MSGMGKEPVTGKHYDQFIAEQGSAWREAWRRAVGEDAVLRTDPRWDSMVAHLGYGSVSVKWEVESALARAIKTDSTLVQESQERLREVQAIPDDRLTPRHRAHLRLARRIADGVLYTKVAGVHAAIIPPASERTRTAGLYSRTTREVFISLEQLDMARTTVDTLVHELAHFTSDADDLSEAHSNEMTRLASRVVEHTSKREFDEELKEAEW